MPENRWIKVRFCSQKCNSIWKVKSGVSYLAGKKSAKGYWESPKRQEQRRINMLGQKRALGYRHTKDAKKRISITHSGEKHWQWKGGGASYNAIHKWLLKNFGPANKCENLNCPKLQSFRYEYALLVNRNHTHDRTAYKMMCIPCHRSYDSRLNKFNVKL